MTEAEAERERHRGEVLTGGLGGSEDEVVVSSVCHLVDVNPVLPAGQQVIDVHRGGGARELCNTASSHCLLTVELSPWKPTAFDPEHTLQAFYKKI